MSKNRHIYLINGPVRPTDIKVFRSSVGSEKKTVFKYVYSEKIGCPVRVKNGSYSIMEYIQQSADDVDFKAIGKMLVDTKANVVDHFNLGGDVLDVTGLPRNIHEYEALHNKMMAEYEKLPVDFRSQFTDFTAFSRAWQNGSLGKMFESYIKGVEDVSVVKQESNPSPSPTPVVTTEKKEGN